MITFWIFMQCT